MIEQLSAWIAAGLATLVIGGFFGWLAATSERFAGPRRAKAAGDQTLMDKAIIEADKRLKGKPSADLDEAKKLAFNLPVDEKTATSAEVLAAFQSQNPDADATKKKAQLEESWATAARTNYGRAAQLAASAT